MHFATLLILLEVAVVIGLPIPSFKDVALVAGSASPTGVQKRETLEVTGELGEQSTPEYEFALLYHLSHNRQKYFPEGNLDSDAGFRREKIEASAWLKSSLFPLTQGIRRKRSLENLGTHRDASQNAQLESIYAESDQKVEAIRKLIKESMAEELVWELAGHVLLSQGNHLLARWSLEQATDKQALAYFLVQTLLAQGYEKVTYKGIAEYDDEMAAIRKVEEKSIFYFPEISHLGAKYRKLVKSRISIQQRWKHESEGSSSLSILGMCTPKPQNFQHPPKTSRGITTILSEYLSRLVPASWQKENDRKIAIELMIEAAAIELEIIASLNRGQRVVSLRKINEAFYLQLKAQRHQSLAQDAGLGHIDLDSEERYKQVSSMLY